MTSRAADWQPHRRRSTLSGMLAALALASLTLATPYLAASKDKKDKKKDQAQASKVLRGLPITELSEDEAILHALNRLGYGPRPGDIERVKQMGLEKWIEQQLNPDSISDSAVQARLERYPTLAMSSSQLLDNFPQPDQAAKRAGLTKEEYRQQLREERHDERKAARAAEQMNPSQPDNKMMPPEEGGRPAPFGGKRGLAEADPNNPRINFEDVRTPQRIIAELSMAKLTRALYSERQLHEQMADFWFNHFNVFAGKGADRWLLTSYERDTIRPHVLGKFRDLLHATAKSPAMLFYLDNWMSADPKAFERMQAELAQRRQRFYTLYGMRDPLWMGMGRPRLGRLGRRFPPDAGRNPMPGGQPGQPPRQRRERGLNENYARELMELHTLGVDGGYTQQDVIEVARCFTGWTMRAPRRDPEFFFDDRLHDPGAKVVLGHKIHAGGLKDGEEVLDLLARHPSTAKFISTKLARHFVSDNPSPELVDRMAKTFLQSDGDIKAVLHTMIYSPEFWARQAYRAKIKTPFELVASAARAVSADVDVPLPMVMWTARIGQPLYMCQPPTGYSDKAEIWVNTGALLNRLNYALALAGNRLRGTRVDLGALLESEAAGDPKRALDRAIHVLLANQASPQTRSTLEKQMSDPQVLQAKLDDPIRQVDVGVIAGLVLGAPEFQRR